MVKMMKMERKLFHCQILDHPRLTLFWQEVGTAIKVFPQARKFLVTRVSPQT